LGLELKSDDFLQEDVCRRLSALLSEMGMLDRTFALSFSQARIEAIRRYAPDLPIGLITLFKVTPPKLGELVGPLWPMMFVNPFYVRAAHRRGQLVCPLDPTPESRLWYYRALGCDVVLSNDPALTLKKLGLRTKD
jgi:glycerophosphoryl diester phosphodiesterase